jgi:hypothetical protein
MRHLVNVADLVDPETGKTWRQLNMEKQHVIRTGSLVEVCASGVRLFVAWQGRDCDGTPLYWLTPDADAVRYDNTHAPHSEWGRGSYIGGYSDVALRVIIPAGGA